MNAYKYIIAAMLVSTPVCADDAFGQPDNIHDVTVVVLSSGGGAMGKFQQTAFDYIRNHVTLVIDGRCDSACTVAADIIHVANGNVYVTERAVFGYHMQCDPGNTNCRPMLVRKEIYDYVAANGGWRKHGVPTVDVGFDVLKQWYRVWK